jgi:hypothetical protein
MTAGTDPRRVAGGGGWLVGLVRLDLASVAGMRAARRAMAAWRANDGTKEQGLQVAQTTRIICKGGLGGEEERRPAHRRARAREEICTSAARAPGRRGQAGKLGMLRPGPRARGAATGPGVLVHGVRAVAPRHRRGGGRPRQRGGRGRRLLGGGGVSTTSGGPSGPGRGVGLRGERGRKRKKCGSHV